MRSDDPRSQKKVDTLTQFIDDAATVGALDQWPRGRLVPAAVLALSRAVGSAGDGIGGDLDVSAVPTEAVLISVVHARRQDLEPNLPAAGIGMGTCWISIISKPPLPRVIAAIIVRVMTGA